MDIRRDVFDPSLNTYEQILPQDKGKRLDIYEQMFPSPVWVLSATTKDYLERDVNTVSWKRDTNEL